MPGPNLLSLEFKGKWAFTWRSLASKRTYTKVVSNPQVLTSFLVALAVNTLCIHWNFFRRCEKRIFDFFNNFFFLEFKHLWALFKELLTLVFVNQIETNTFLCAVQRKSADAGWIWSRLHKWVPPIRQTFVKAQVILLTAEPRVGSLYVLLSSYFRNLLFKVFVSFGKFRTRLWRLKHLVLSLQLFCKLSFD